MTAIPLDLGSNYQPGEGVILQGDVLAGLGTLGDATVQTVVTSPPYWGMRDYGVPGQIGAEPDLGTYISRLVKVFSEVYRVLRKDGTLWLNLGDMYTPGRKTTEMPDKKLQNRSVPYLRNRPAGIKEKELIGVPWRVALALQAEGWYLRTDIIWNRPNAMPEKVKDRPSRTHEFVFLFTKGEQYLYRFDGYDSFIGRSVWNIHTKPFAGAHFACFPTKLVQPCIQAGSSWGDTVLDPFFGSGTVGQVARNLGRQFVGIELNPEYVEVARKRLREYALYDCPVKVL
jgi:site-specific DNA-methyltransferase (cytosine-N4-specific)